jgi:hypothetical protein
MAGFGDEEIDTIAADSEADSQQEGWKAPV